MFFSQYNLKHTFMGTIGHTFLERELVERKIEIV